MRRKLRENYDRENTGAKKVLTSEFSNWQRSSIACTSAGYRGVRASERINWRGVHDTCPSNTQARIA